MTASDVTDSTGRAEGASSPEARRAAAKEVGGRTLELFADTPRLNAWYYSKLSAHVAGDVLELGSGTGNLTRLIVEDAHSLVATEVEAPYLAALRRAFAHDPRVTVAGFDLEGAPPPAIAERRFDTVISVNVLEHVADDGGAVRRLSARLRPGGWMLAYVPAVPWAYGTMDRNLAHHRRYTRRSLRALMTQAGLRVDRLEAMNLLGLAGWFVNGRILRRAAPDPVQVKAFDRLVPLVRLEDRRPPPIGLGLVVHAQKPPR
ncbi:MAG: class I SAM-dependent methyltransferase [Sandaracinaceae bacterium]